LNKAGFDDVDIFKIEGAKLEPFFEAHNVGFPRPNFIIIDNSTTKPGHIHCESLA
jgi:hypothetical protein